MRRYHLKLHPQPTLQEIKNHIHERTGGSLDYLVNNAGRNYTVPALDIDFAEVQSVFESNVFAVMRLCQAFAPLLIQSKGTIINIGSVAARISYVFGSVYNASKGALHAYSDTLRVELAPFEVNVIVVVTGGVRSNLCRTHRELSESSMNLPFDAEYMRRQLHPQEVVMDTAVYAAKVVRAVLKPYPANSVWKGSQASKVWLLLTVFPRIFWDYYFAMLFNMGKAGKVCEKLNGRVPSI